MEKMEKLKKVNKLENWKKWQNKSEFGKFQKIQNKMKTPYRTRNKSTKKWPKIQSFFLIAEIESPWSETSRNAIKKVGVSFDK